MTRQEGDEFTGFFQVDFNGELERSDVKGITATGLEPDQLQSRIDQALVNQGVFQSSCLKGNVRVVPWEPMEVLVEQIKANP